MTISPTKFIIIAFLFVDLISPQILVDGQQRVPCFFQFGDSLSDNGNNNNLISTAKSNFLPYGIDFVYGPIGKFTNGLSIPDFGQRIPMNQQLLNHNGTVDQIGTLLGNQTAAENLLRKCLYTVTMGNYDYILNYYNLPLTLTRILYTPEKFADKLIQQYSKQLTTLYNLQARKVAVFGVGPIGCLPSSLSLYPTRGSPCVEFINDAVQLFNHKLVSLVHNLNTNLHGANFTYINLYSFLSADLTTILGIKVPSAPCCDINKLLGLCVPKGNVCSNIDEYTYFDKFNPTQIIANYTVSRAYIAKSASDAIPVDIRTLVQQ